MLLELRDIQKRFGGVPALQRGNLAVREGEVDMLMGEKGAGKSTLMRIVAGMLSFDGGEMLWRRQSVSFAIPPKRRGTASRWSTRSPCWAPILP